MLQNVKKESNHASIVDEFADVFTGIGLFLGECNIQRDPKVTPVIHPPRRNPFALHDQLKEELRIALCKCHVHCQEAQNR